MKANKHIKHVMWTKDGMSYVGRVQKAFNKFPKLENVVYSWEHVWKVPARGWGVSKKRRCPTCVLRVLHGYFMISHWSLDVGMQKNQ